MNRRSLVKLLRALVAVAILGWVAWRLAADWAALSALTLEPALPDVIGATASGIGALLLLAALYAGLLRGVGLARPGHTAFYLRIWLQSYFYRYIPGKVLLVVERVRLGERVGIPKTTGVVLVLFETLLLLVGACLLGGIGLAGAGSALADAPPLPAIIAVGVLGLGAVLAAPKVLELLLPRIPFLRDRVPELAVKASPGAWLGLSLGYAAVWSLLGLSFALTCRWFPEGRGAGLEEALWYVLAYVGGLILGLTPAGLGVREGLLVAGLATRYPPTTALAFALASRVLMTLVELPVVGLATLVPEPPQRKP